MYALPDTSLCARPANRAKVEDLLTMLTYMRKHGSQSEVEFIERFIDPLLQHPNATQFARDSFGNVFIEVRGGSDVLFTAHTDSVHGDDGTQEVLFDANLGVAYKADRRPLGADDAAGMWLLMALLDAGVPCWLAFFRAEEVGGRGSDFAAKDNPEFFGSFKACISLDRKGTSDVITHQGFGRCCSDTFATHLSSALNEHGLAYAPCDGGIFTDSANLTHLIGECTNVASGYNNEHTEMEELDVEHLIALRDALVRIDWTALPAVRQPGEEEWDTATFKYSRRLSDKFTSIDTHYHSTQGISVSDLYDMTRADMLDAMYDDPESFADVVWELLWGDAQPIDPFNDEEN